MIFYFFGYPYAFYFVCALVPKQIVQHLKSQSIQAFVAYKFMTYHTLHYL